MPDTPSDVSVPTPLQLAQVAMEVVKEFADGIAILDDWAYDQSELAHIAIDLRCMAMLRAREHGFSPLNRISVGEMAMSLFWQWVGRLEMWEALQRSPELPNPRLVFPWMLPDDTEPE